MAHGRAVAVLVCASALTAGAFASGGAGPSGDVVRARVAQAPAAPSLRFVRRAVARGGNDPNVTAADLDGDGNPDLLTADLHSASVSVLLGTGTGRFHTRVAYATARYPVVARARDLDGDGDRDVVTVGGGEHAGSVVVFTNQGDGRLRRVATYTLGDAVAGVAMGDLDGDRIVDLVLVAEGRTGLQVMLGAGGARFRSASRYAVADASDVALADLDADGRLDVAVSTFRGHVAIRLGRGDGTFTDERRVPSGHVVYGIGVADLDNDHRADILLGGLYGVWVHLGAGDGTFAAGTRYRMGDGDHNDVVTADFNRDGVLDIATDAGGDSDGVPFSAAIVRRGIGDGTFDRAEKVARRFVAPTNSIAVADFDRDGRPDLALGEDVDVAACDYDACFAHPHRIFVFLDATR